MIGGGPISPVAGRAWASVEAEGAAGLRPLAWTSAGPGHVRKLLRKNRRPSRALSHMPGMTAPLISKQRDVRMSGLPLH